MATEPISRALNLPLTLLKRLQKIFDPSRGSINSTERELILKCIVDQGDDTKKKIFAQISEVNFVSRVSENYGKRERTAIYFATLSGLFMVFNSTHRLNFAGEYKIGSSSFQFRGNKFNVGLWLIEGKIGTLEFDKNFNTNQIDISEISFDNR